MQSIRTKPVATINDVASMLAQGQVEQALASILHSGQDSPPWCNARGVCQLRLGKLDEAARTFRTLAFPAGSIVVPDETPPLYVANFITAMLLKRNFEAAVPLLEHLPNDGTPYVTQLLEAAQRWKRSLTWFERLRCYIGWYPDRSFPLDIPSGGL